MREQVSGIRGKRDLALFLGVMAMTLSAFAFAPVPKESAQALKVTRGKPFSSGAVFVNGKYVEPPYVVERWGTGIRVNGKAVTGQVVDWNDFLKTQAATKVVKSEQSAPPAPAPAAEEDVDASSLDDLFDDDPKPKRSAGAVRTGAARMRQTVTYSLEGEFVPNDATRSMVARINAYRTEIDRTLRSGGFICFGDAYSQMTGDSRTLLDLLEKLPEIQRSARSEQDFCERIREAGLIYLNEVLRQDLYRNRIDYRKLLDLRVKLQKDLEYKKVLDEVSKPLF